MSDWQLRMGDGDVFARSGDLKKAQVAFRDAWEAAPDDQARSRALGALGVITDRLGEPVAATLLEEAVELAREADPEQLSARLHDLGVCRLQRGDPAAVDALEEAWPLHADDRLRLRSLEMLGEAALRAAPPRVAESVYVQARWVAEQLGEPMAVVRSINGRGEALRRQGRMEEAKRAFQAVVESLGRLPDPDPAQQEQAGVALHNLGVLMIEARPVAAAEMLEGAIRCFVGAFGTRQHPHVARSVAFLGRIEAERGRSAEAAARYAEARSLVPADHPVATELLPLLGA